MKKTLRNTALSLSLLTISVLANDTLATVNGTKITEANIAEVVGQLGVDIKKLPAQLKKSIVDQYIDKTLIEADVSKDTSITSDKKYLAEIESFKKETAFKYWAQKAYDSIKVTDADIKKYYDENKKQFIKPAEYKARHILVKTEKEAKELITKLDGAKEKEKTFIELAKKHSTGPSGVQGGELGWFTAKKMVPEFSAAAATLAKGSYTKTPVKTSFGYHLIFLEDKKTEDAKKFDEIKDSVKTLLVNTRLQQKIKDKSQALRKNAKIEYSSTTK